jgi:hypothetical protein
MRVVKASVDPAGQPRGTSIAGLVAGLPGRAISGFVSVLARFRPVPGLDRERVLDDDIWLSLLASDPDGIWYLWPADERKAPLDEATSRP